MESDDRAVLKTRSIDRGESFEVEEHPRIKVAKLLRGKDKTADGDVYDAFLSNFKTTFSVTIDEKDDDSMDGFAAGYVRSDGGVDEHMQSSEQTRSFSSNFERESGSAEKDDSSEQHGAEDKVRTVPSDGSAEAFRETTSASVSEASALFSQQASAEFNDSMDQTRFISDENGEATQDGMDGKLATHSFGSAAYAENSTHSSFENLDQDSKPLIDGDAGEDLALDSSQLDQENLNPSNMPFDLFKKKKDKKKKKTKDGADKHATEDASSATADPTSTELQTATVAADGGDITHASTTEDGSKMTMGDTSDVTIDQKVHDSPAVLQTGAVTMTSAEGPQLTQSEGGVVDSQPTKSQGREKESLLHDHSPEGLICCTIL